MERVGPLGVLPFFVLPAGCRAVRIMRAGTRSVKIHRLKINLSGCRFENKRQFCISEKPLRAAPCMAAGRISQPF